MGIRVVGQGVSIVEVVDTTKCLRACLRAWGKEVVTVFGGKAVRRFSATRQDFEEHAEGAVVVFSNFAGYLQVLQAGLGVAKTAPQGFIF